MLNRHPTTAAAIALALSLGSAGAHALKLDMTGIINISATSGMPTTVEFDPGTYTVQWIGQADGGAYNAWTYNTATSGNYRDAFTLTIGGTVFTVDKPVPNPYANFATAADALAAFQSGSYVVYAGTTSGAYQPSMQVGTAAVPTFTLSAPTTVDFSVPDYQFSDNTGGVSLRVTAVPEPETLALMLVGLAAIGLNAKVLRKARRAR